MANFFAPDVAGDDIANLGRGEVVSGSSDWRNRRDGRRRQHPQAEPSRPRKTLADLDALPRYEGPPESIDEISRLSDEDIHRLIKEDSATF